jgi:hypothetical protein
MRLRSYIEFGGIFLFADSIHGSAWVIVLLAALDIMYGLYPPKRRAYRLMMRTLSFKHRWQLRLRGFVTVIGSDSHRYHVRYLPMDNVRDVTVKRTYCGAPKGSLPLEDKLLGTKLCLEANAPYYKGRAFATSGS